jgi:glycosyltransferase involved in cell wall biosynthesis
MCHTGEEFGIRSDAQYAQHYGYEQWYCNAMLEQGIDVTLIVLSHRTGITEFKHIFGHRIIRVPISLSFGVSRQFSIKLFKILYDLRKDTIFHVNSFYALLYEPLSLFFKLTKAKFVVQSQSSHYSTKNPIHIIRLLILFFSLRLPNKVLTVNPIEFEEIKKRYRLKTALAFPNGVDTRIFTNLSLQRRRNSILYAGRLWPEKGLDVLFSAFERLKTRIPDLTLTIIGRGPLETIVVEMQRKYRNSINYLNYIDNREELVNLYNTHELFVLPSLNEPFGIVIIESLACGTPVITCDNCGAAAFLKKYNCVETVPPNNSVLLASKIEQLLNDTERLWAMGKAGREAVVQNFDWSVLGNKLKKIYFDIS